MIRVGFLLSLDTSWQGGLNYFKSLFNSVYNLPNRQLDVVVFLGTKETHLIPDGFPAIDIVASSAFDRYSLLWCLRKFFQRLFHKDLILSFLVWRYKIDLISHFNEPVLMSYIPVISWIPDFQHLHLPHFFSEKELSRRNLVFQQQISHGNAILLSSEDALNDLNMFSPNHSTKTHVLKFTPSLPNSSNLLGYSEIAERYKLDRPWFHLPNQFWAHKNHGVVLESLKLLKTQDVNVLVAATGSTSDYRNSEYFPSLMKRIHEYGLEDNFLILGILPYTDMIAILRHSVAVINPSLFEGWSTTVEEAKAIGKVIILSDIACHREQNPHRGFYFDAHNPSELANIMIDAINSYDESNEIEIQSQANEVARKNILLFGEKYQQIVLNTLIQSNSSS